MSRALATTAANMIVLRLLMAVLLAAGMSCVAYADTLDLLKAGLAARRQGDFAAACSCPAFTAHAR